jgi:ketosteroid isomerase-like protein
MSPRGPTSFSKDELAWRSTGIGERRRHAVEVVESCFAAISAQDVERLVSHYTDDYILELPYFKPDESLVVEGREQARAYLGSILGRQCMRIELTTVRWVPDEELLIAEYTCSGEFMDDGEPYQNRYVGYWFFEGDRVSRLREYYNPQAPRASAID